MYIKDDNQCQFTVVHNYTTLVCSNSIDNSSVCIYTCACPYTSADCLRVGWWAGPSERHAVTQLYVMVIVSYCHSRRASRAGPSVCVATQK